MLRISLIFLLGLFFLAGCGQSGDIQVKGASPITKDEINYWIKYQLASRNFNSRNLVDLQAPLDPPKFSECQKFLQKQMPTQQNQPASSSSSFLSLCKYYYNTLRQSVVNTLIVSRWAQSPNNSLRGTIPKRVPRIMSELEVNSTFPSSPEKKKFFRQTGLNFDILTKRRALDVTAFQYIERSKENISPPSKKEIDTYIKNNASKFKSLPEQTKRARAERLLTQEKLAQRSAPYDIDQVRKATTCPDWLDSPLCGNRPAPVGENNRTTILALPLVPPSADVDIRGKSINISARAQGIDDKNLDSTAEELQGSPLPPVSRAEATGVEVVIEDDSKDVIARKQRR